MLSTIETDTVMVVVMRLYTCYGAEHYLTHVSNKVHRGEVREYAVLEGTV